MDFLSKADLTPEQIEIEAVLMKYSLKRKENAKLR